MCCIEWVTDRCLMTSEQFFSHIMARTRYIQWRWWCTSAPCLIRFFIVLAHWNSSLWVDMLLHSDTFSLFWVNQSLFLFLKAASLAVKHQMPISSSLVWPHDLHICFYCTLLKNNSKLYLTKNWEKIILKIFNYDLHDQY